MIGITSSKVFNYREVWGWKRTKRNREGRKDRRNERKNMSWNHLHILTFQFLSPHLPVKHSHLFPFLNVVTCLSHHFSLFFYPSSSCGLLSLHPSMQLCDKWQEVWVAQSGFSSPSHSPMLWVRAVSLLVMLCPIGFLHLRLIRIFY